MTFQKVKLKDLAKALSLSESTVSKALRDSHEISAATKVRVKKHAVKINYRLNHNASNLRSLRSYLIGVLVPDIKMDFMAQAISGINSVAQRHSSLVLISETMHSQVKELKQLGNLVSRSIDGLIISPSALGTNIAYLKELAKREMPIVVLNDVIPELNACKVVSNDYTCVFEGISKLLSCGLRKMAYVSKAERTYVSKQRLNGFRDAFSKFGIALTRRMVLLENQKACPLEFERQITMLVQNEDGPEILFTADDITTTLVFKILSRMATIRPNLKIIGVTNSEIAELSNQNISYLQQPAYEMGQVAAELLFDIINNDQPETYKTITLNSKIDLKQHHSQLQVPA